MFKKGKVKILQKEKFWSNFGQIDFCKLANNKRAQNFSNISQLEKYSLLC